MVRTSLQINSEILKEILADVIGSYPGQSFHTSTISIDFPARCLYYHRQDLTTILENFPEDCPADGKEHLRILCDFVAEHHKDAIAEGDNLRAAGLVSYEHLWTIFRPGINVFAQAKFGQPRAYKLLSHQYVCGRCPGFQLYVQYTDFDGDRFGTRYEYLTIPQFEGATPIVGLSVYPLAMASNPELLTAMLVARGRKFESLAGQRFREYRGVAFDSFSRYNIDGRVMIDTATYHRIEADEAFSVNEFPKSERDNTVLSDAPTSKWKRALAMANSKAKEPVATASVASGTNTDGTASPATAGQFVVVDNNSDGTTASRKRKEPPAVSQGSAMDLVSEEDDDDLGPEDPPTNFPRLTDEQCLRASAQVRGFSFSEKKFLDFFVDQLQPITWNRRCFEQLVLPESHKELVQALVAEHTARRVAEERAARAAIEGGDNNGNDLARVGFDDIVKGKGKGLILVLHGPPGVGKTLTAECVAEFSRRPLYIVSSGDLGTSATTLDERLSRTLDLASTWKAVLLIDEADVFLERRSLRDLERNSLVSIFLRTLEYYSGILFMTTNRVRTFDDAFKSRIHVPLKYEELPADSRVRIWRNFLDGVDGSVDVDEAGLRALAQSPLNGRQIKNVVRTARSLANHKRRRLDLAQLQQVMEIQMAFERDLDSATGDIDMVET